MLIDDIKKICDQCGLVDDASKSVVQLEVKTITPGWEWTDATFREGDFGYSFCLTERHVPPAYYDKGGNQVIYMDVHKKTGKDPFIKGLWLYIPTITHSGHLRFMQRVMTKEIYKPELIFKDIKESFIPFNDSIESYIPEVSMDGAEDMVIDLVKKYLTNVAAVCKSLCQEKAPY